MAGSTIVIRCDGTDITRHVLVSGTYFELLAGAAPGSFQMTIKDTAQVHSFTTGKIVTVELDGKILWGGFVMGVAYRFFFPAVDTSVPAAVTTRQFVLRGVDYNILFDRRVLRNTSDYLHHLPNFDAGRYDGDLIRSELTDNVSGGPWLDLPADLNAYDYVDDVVPPFDPELEGVTGEGAWLQQGSTWRAQMDDFAQFSGAVYYILPIDDNPYTMALHYHSLETVTSDWGFSDVPNGTTRIGMRELDASEDGEPITNDALVWGGSEWSGDGETVFAREQNEDSIDDHNRWQIAEIHFGERGFKTQRGVNARANVIVNGAPGSVGGDPNRGLRFPQWDVKLVWWSKDVPGADHLVPGDIVPIDLTIHDKNLLLPLRSLRMTFPTLDPNGNPHVRFEGRFSLQPSDPKTLWTYLRRLRRQRERQGAVIATASSSSTTYAYGAIYGGQPLPAPDGVETVFTLDPATFAYIASTTEVYLNGLLQIPGTDYTESDPLTGEITFTSPPGGSDELWIRCRLA